MGCEERERGSIFSCRRRKQGVEFGDDGCIAGVCGTNGQIQFAGFLEFAPKKED